MLTHLDATLERFERHLDANPEDADARLVYADCLEELGRHAQADLQRRVARREVWPWNLGGTHGRARYSWYLRGGKIGHMDDVDFLSADVFDRLRRTGGEYVAHNDGLFFDSLAAALSAVARAWEPEGT